MIRMPDRKEIRSNTLFTLAVFIAFLLLFESGIVVPLWLQPFGRMHAMVVHLPIVLILLAAVLEVTRFHVKKSGAASYFGITRELLFAGSLLSGLVVVMGIFLGREDAYDTQAVTLHKWSGVLVFFLSLILFVTREQSWFSAVHARGGAALLAGSILAAGHFGGSLTHGESFVLQPLASSLVADAVIRDTLAFDHVVKPILESRCRSCHNPLKNKGRLLLSDSASIVRGGKSGPLFVAGDPEKSLLIQRIALPLDEKKHMPPSDKPQLTEEEKTILHHWIRSGAAFQTRVMDLPASDSFRIVAVQMLEQRAVREDQFDFPSAASETIERLNSNYRVIRPVSRNSPAVTVNVYNHSLYSSTMIEELSAIRQQIVALDLGNMPVTDEDLRHIALLTNLRRLNLNFTSITGDGLARLRVLQRLEHLSIAGTTTGYSEVKGLLGSLPDLRRLAIWETLLSDAEIGSLQRDYPYVRILGSREENSELIRLNSPRIANKRRVFDDSIGLVLAHPVRGTEIRFTTDGSDPDSVSAPLYDGHLIVDKTTGVKAKAYKKGWLSSDVTTLNIYRSAHKPDTAIMLSKLNRVHVQKGAATFFDHELGTFNANSPAWANNWGGVRGNDLVLLLKYDMPRRVGSLSLNCLVEIETAIFPPETIEVWGGDSPENFQLIGRRKVQLPSDYQKPYIQLFDCELDDFEVTHLKIVATPVMKLPDWHRGAGRQALLLVDEILVN